MAGTNAIAAFGTFLKIGDGGGTEVFTTIAEVRDIKGPKLTMETKEVTNQSSPGAFKDYIGTVLDGGDVTFDINYIPTETTHNATAGLLACLKNKTRRNFKLVFSDAGTTTWLFAAYVTSFDPTSAVAAELTASITLKIAGQPTLV